MTVAGRLAAPAIARGEAVRPLRFIPHADLANFDPIWNPAYIARQAGLLIWDTLYGVDSTLTPQRQMIEAEEVTPDGLTWTFRLRPGLVFHDGEAVLARDAVASINRWAARDAMGQMIKAVEDELAANDDRTFRWSLRKPFPRMLLALGKVGTPCCVIMPERIARTDPFRQINEHVGSGPMRFVRDEWVPGARAVFAKSPRYLPRPEPASWLAGGKRMTLERLEWLTIPDPATAGAALRSGEVDWWERPLPDLVPLLRRSRDLVVEVLDTTGFTGLLLMNHLYPPFNDVRARRAILMAMSQRDYMRAFVGDDDALWRPMPGYFMPGSPLFTDRGGQVLAGPRDLDGARRLLRESGYAGQPIVTMAAQDLPYFKAWGEVTVDMLRQLGMTVEDVSVDWGTVVARRAQKSPPGQGGWHIYHTGVSGTDCVDPTNKFIRAKGDQAVNGWADSPAVEAHVTAWFEGGDPAAEAERIAALNEAALEYVVYAPLGAYVAPSAWRKTVTGISKGPLPFFWGVGKQV